MENQNKWSKYDQHLEELEKKSSSTNKKRILLASLLLGASIFGYFGVSQLTSKPSDANAQLATQVVQKDDNTMINKSPFSETQAVTEIQATEEKEKEKKEEGLEEEEEKAEEKDAEEVRVEEEEQAEEETNKEENDSEFFTTESTQEIASSFTTKSSNRPSYGVSSTTTTRPVSSTINKKATTSTAKVAQPTKVKKATPKKVEKKKEEVQKKNTPKPEVKEVAAAPKKEAKPEEKVEETKPKVKVKSYSQPQFPGGKKALRKFLKRNVKYPSKALTNKVEGKVSVSVTINEKGKIVGSKVVEGIGSGCDEQILKAVSKMPTWKPAVLNGEAIEKTYRISFRFAIPD